MTREEMMKCLYSLTNKDGRGLAEQFTKKGIDTVLKENSLEKLEDFIKVYTYEP